MSGLVVADWQAELDGLLFGAGTPYAVTNWAGFLDLGGVRSAFTQRTRAHGGFTEPHFGGGAARTLEFNISPTPTVSFAAAVAALRAGTYPQDGVRPLWFQMPGIGLLTGGFQVLNRSIPIEQAYAFALVNKAAVQLYFPDPLWYGPTVSALTRLPITSGGLAYPLSYPLAYGSPVTGRVSAANAGSAVTAPVFTIMGPIDIAGFQVASIEDGISIQYNGSLSAGDQLVIDTRTGSVVLNGTADRRNLLGYSTWPNIPASSTRTFAFTTLGTYQAAASMTVAWAPAYW